MSNSRKALREELMSLSQVTNRLSNVLPFINDEHKSQLGKLNHQNSTFISDILEGPNPYNFLKFAISKVIVYGGIQSPYGKYTEVNLFDLCVAILKLPNTGETFTTKQRGEHAMPWVSCEMPTYKALLTAFEVAQVEKSATLEAAIFLQNVVQSVS